MIIVCAIDNNYIRHCAVMLRSLYESNPKEEIIVYIIHGEIDASEKKKLAAYLGRFLSSVSFVQIDQKLLEEVPVFGHITLSTYYRLLLPVVLPRDIQRVIFLDSDLIVVGSLKELWQTDLDDYPMAAVMDHGLKSNCERLGLSLESGYFNAGVMLIDMNKWRSIDILSPGLAFAKKNQTKLNNWDQDIFNHLFEAQWLHLDARWNAQPHIWDLYKGNADDGVGLTPQETAARNKPVIIHFAGGGTVKPWHYHCAHPWKTKYLELKNKTPWARVPLESRPASLPVRLWRRILKCENIYDHFYINIFRRFTKKYTIVDMGANEGLFAKAFLSRHPVSAAVLIEPNPYLAQRLISDFKDRNVHILNAAVGLQVSESTPFYLSKNREASSLNKELAREHGLAEEGSQINVKTTTLKEVCSLFDLKKIDLLKVDIEGAEYDLLENISKEDLKKIDQISIEFHDFIDPLLRKRTENCIKKIRSHGYLFIHAGTSCMRGSPYFNCLFFKKRIALIRLILQSLRAVKSLVRK